MQMAYSQVEDRLLLRFNTKDGTEFRFWLTRLFIKQFWPGLVKAMEVNLPAQSAGHKRSMMGFMHQNVVEQANFSSAFEPTNTSCPLGEAPLLVCRSHIQEKGPGLHLLSLYPEKGYGVELGMDQKLLHLLCKLIQDTILQVDWGLALSLPGTDMEGTPTLTEGGSSGRQLH